MDNYAAIIRSHVANLKAEERERMTANVNATLDRQDAQRNFAVARWHQYEAFRYKTSLPFDIPAHYNISGYEVERHWHYHDPRAPYSDGPCPLVTFDKEATRVRLMKQTGKAFFGFHECDSRLHPECVL